MLSNKERGFKVSVRVLGGMEIPDEGGGFESDAKIPGGMEATSNKKSFIARQF